MKRYLYQQTLQDLKRKLVFITGPRQVGKTFLAKQLMEEFSFPQYLSYDNINDLKIINGMNWANNTDLLIFDEIHKMKNWKSYLKGIYDSKPSFQSILVTGSARLDTFRQSGESLAGRYLHLRLNPFSVKEISQYFNNNYDALTAINRYGAFPEPFFLGLNLTKDEAGIETSRWKNQYYIDLIREDILEFSKITEISSMKLLLQLLRSKVGTPLSYNSISNDLQVSPNTIKKYVQILKSLYLIFLVRPFHKNIARSIIKEPKVYFYDSSFIDGDDGIKLENTVAVNLLKNVQYLIDAKGEDIQLNYVRNKDGKEIDFAISKNGNLTQLIEVKLSDDKISPSLKYFAERFENVECIQLVHNLKQNKLVNKVNVFNAADWLCGLAV